MAGLVNFTGYHHEADPQNEETRRGAQCETEVSSEAWRVLLRLILPAFSNKSIRQPMEILNELAILPSNLLILNRNIFLQDGA